MPAIDKHQLQNVRFDVRFKTKPHYEWDALLIILAVTCTVIGLAGWQ